MDDEALWMPVRNLRARFSRVYKTRNATYSPAWTQPLTPKPSSPPLSYPEAVKSKSLPSELCRTGDSGLKSWESWP